MNKDIKDLIKQYEVKGSFTYETISDEQIKEAENSLSVKIPSQYLEFLQEYGFGGIGGVEIIGVGGNGNLVFVEETLEYRRYGLPDNLIVIEDCGEWIYCINAETEAVISWTEGFIKEEYSDFDSYVFDRFTDAAENL